jgi:hypothetical protein
MGILLLVGYFLGKWTGVMVAAALYATSFVGRQWVSWARGRRKKRERQAMLVCPCPHGIKGAANDVRLCAVCVFEMERRQQQARHQAEERRLRQEAQRRETAKEVHRSVCLRGMSPADFEKLVLTLFIRMGFQIDEIPSAGDTGAARFIFKDGNKTVLRCIHDRDPVTEPVLHELIGIMHATSSTDVIVVATERVSRFALAPARGKPIRIIEMPELIRMLGLHFSDHEWLAH